MKSRLFFTVAMIIATQSQSFSNDLQTGDGASNGGWAQAMIQADLRERKPINAGILNKVVEKGGLEIKKEILLPTMKSFLEGNDDGLSKRLLELKKMLKLSQEELYESVIYSPIKIGKCGTNQNLCTGDTPFSDIIIDSGSVLNQAFGLTFSELIGLIAHEYTHHFVGDFDHPNYEFARFVRDNIKSKSYGSKAFTLEKIIQSCESDDYKWNRCLLRSKDNQEKDQEQADLFCKEKGLKKSISYLAESIPFLDWMKLNISFRSGFPFRKTYYPVFNYQYTYAEKYRKLGYQVEVDMEYKPSSRKAFTKIECSH